MLKASAVVRKGEKGESLRAEVVDASGGGILLMVRSVPSLVLGDELICDVSLPAGLELAIPRHGMGTVVRVDGERTAIQFNAAVF